MSWGGRGGFSVEPIRSSRCPYSNRTCFSQMLMETDTTAYRKTGVKYTVWIPLWAWEELGLGFWFPKPNHLKPCCYINPLECGSFQLRGLKWRGKFLVCVYLELTWLHFLPSENGSIRKKICLKLHKSKKTIFRMKNTVDQKYFTYYM